MSQVRIILTDPVKGYLTIKDGSSFPLNFSIGDIRDISKRTGSYSKTITLVGNKENNKLLGHLYDINVVDGSFNINKLQKCIVEQDGIVILDNMYLHLSAVKKVQKTTNYDYEVEYEAQLKDSSSDLFSKISNLELTDLDFSEFNDHIYTVPNILSSFSHTWQDGYKYVLPYKDTTVSVNDADRQYILKEMRAGIYARQYWDKIFAQSGYRYTFDQKDNSDILFSKLIIPYNGEDIKVEDDIDLIVKAENTSTLTKLSYGGVDIGSGITPSGPNGPTFIVLGHEITDTANQYNPSTGVFTPAFTITNPGVVTCKFVIDYTVELVAAANITLTSEWGDLSSGSNIIRPGFILRNVTTGVAAVQMFNTYTIPFGTSYTTGTHQLTTGTIAFEMELTDLTTTTQIREQLYLAVNDTTLGNGNGDNLTWKNGSGVGYNPNYKLNLIDINMQIIPKNLSLDYNVPVTMNSFIPKKIKQSDFIKSICQMYNLYIEVDTADPNNLIIKTRDKFYDDGAVVDWSNKLLKEKDQDLKFIPELSSKKIILTYKQDKDIGNVGYFNNTNEIYGQVEYVFANEYVKNTEVKSLIFSPTPMIYTNFNANVPFIEGFEPKNNIRILIDNGVTTCNEYFIKDITNYSVTEYPFISHYADNPTLPSFDINYGVCDFYFYNDYTKTNNNLYNLHWLRTFGQINNGKLLIAQFDLNATDIQKLKLNDKIRIDNSYWLINKIIDYNANSNNSTKVELISIDEDLKLPPFKTKIPTEPNHGASPIKDIVLSGPVGGGPGGGPGGNGGGTPPGPVRPWKPNVILSTGVIATGKDNYIGRNVIGSVYGDNNTATSGFIKISGNNNILYSDANVTGDNNQVGFGISKATIIGDNNKVEPGVNNAFILGNNQTVTESGIYTNNITVTESITLAPGAIITGLLWSATIEYNMAAAVSLTMTADVILVDTSTNAVTITLPTAIGLSGQIRRIKDISGNAETNNVTIDGFSAELIDGSSMYTMAIDYESVTIMSDGTSWWIV